MNIKTIQGIIRKSIPLMMQGASTKGLQPWTTNSMNYNRITVFSMVKRHYTIGVQTKEKIEEAVVEHEDELKKDAIEEINPFPGKILYNDRPKTGKKQLVLLGTGWGGYSLLKKIDLNNYDVQVVSKRSHFLFTPLLPSASSGTLEFRSITEPIRGARGKNQNFHFHQSEAIHIDTDTKQVTCRSVFADNQEQTFGLKYDVLVNAVGCDVNTMGIPGVKDNAFFVKELEDARKIRYRVLECFEKASNPALSLSKKTELLHFIFVGAGPTGIETAAELHDFVKEDLATLYPDLYLHVQFTVITAEDQVLSMFDSKLQEYTRRKFYRDHIKIQMNMFVAGVPTETMVELSDGSRIPCGMVVWCGGNQSRNLLRSPTATASFPKNDLDEILVNDHLEVLHHDNIYAIGDCSCVVDSPLVSTAQVASQQGSYLAKYLNAKASPSSKPVSPFKYNHAGLMAYIGNWHAIIEMDSWKFSGWFSFLLWRSAYLTKLVSIKNKVLVPFDWAKAIIFGRDTIND